jgi:UDP-N-acetylmuramate--alanine ligase
VQGKLEKLGIPYNGSGRASSSITIDKYQTIEILKENGLRVKNSMIGVEAGYIIGRLKKGAENGA